MTECGYCGSRLRTKHRQGASEPRCHACTDADGSPARGVKLLDVTEDTDDDDDDVDSATGQFNTAMKRGMFR